mmetsp:Transcript_3662/g.5644  ORF Transcript_3662/g.5644 Transcript_3662/m.5644 type:complete len:221 (+) Transcript_3662:218-880(+)
MCPQLIFPNGLGNKNLALRNLTTSPYNTSRNVIENIRSINFIIDDHIHQSQGVLQDDGHRPYLWNIRDNPFSDRSRSERAGCQTLTSRHSHGGVCRPWHKVTNANRSTIFRRGNETKLWRDGFRHISHAHQFPRLDANGLHFGKKLTIGVELLPRFMTRQTKIRRTRNDHGHGNIHASHLNAIDDVHDLTSRQKGSRGRTSHLHKIQRYRGGSTWHTIER